MSCIEKRDNISLKQKILFFTFCPCFLWETCTFKVQSYSFIKFHKQQLYLLYKLSNSSITTSVAKILSCAISCNEGNTTSIGPNDSRLVCERVKERVAHFVCWIVFEAIKDIQSVIQQKLSSFQNKTFL